MNADCNSLEERLAEAQAKYTWLLDRPGAIQVALRDSEVIGDVGTADALENELAGYVGVTGAAQFRLGVLRKLTEQAEYDRKQAETSASLAEGVKRHFESQNLPLFTGTSRQNLDNGSLIPLPPLYDVDANWKSYR